MSSQLNLEMARAQGEEGMRAAAAAADAKHAGWADIAFVFLKKWARDRAPRDRFTAEEVTMAYAADPCFVQPDDMRAWGGVFKRAVARGIITVADFNGVRLMGHGTTGAKRYRSLVCGSRWVDLGAK